MRTYLLSILVFLAIVAAVSRILVLKNVDKQFNNMFGALENLYHGVFNL
jgi:hypothetical protein